MAKKTKWWCPECGYNWKARLWNKCPNCRNPYITIRGKKKKKEKMPKTMVDALQRAVASLDDVEVYEGTLEVCECEGHQVCDVCQGVTGDEKDVDVNPHKLDWMYPPEKVSEEINQGHYFEVMDRVHIIQCNISNFLIDHPVMTPTAKMDLEKAQHILTSIYQWASFEHDEFN